jgi:chromate transporter
MTAGQFLNAVALGQITPGPVTQTVAVVGYAAGGLAGGLLAAAVAFSPSFVFVLIGGNRFDRLGNDHRARYFLDGAAVLVLALRRSIVTTILTAAAIGSLVALAGGPRRHT